ncbi:hypothetical protein HOY80DRAFT_1076947 [Tuber brumale]|nr:hypothetical protein HOY80DRAFT_1076947 [Tuber brumale]
MPAATKCVPTDLIACLYLSAQYFVLYTSLFASYFLIRTTKDMPCTGENTQNAQTNQTQTRAPHSSGSQRIGRRQDPIRHVCSPEHPARCSDSESRDEEGNNTEVSSVQHAQVVPQLPSTVASDDDFFSESDVVEFRPRKRTHINLEAPGNNDWRLLIRRHSPTQNRRSTGPRQQSCTQVDLHKRVRTELAWQQPRSLEDTSPSELQILSDSASATSEGKLPRKFWKREFIPPKVILVYDAAKLYLEAEVYTGQPWPSVAMMENMIESAWSLALDQRKREEEEYYRSGDQRPAEQTPSTLLDAISLEMTVDHGDGPRTSWFMVEEIVKLMRSYFFANEHSLGCKPYMQQYFSPLHWLTVLLVCTALRCSLMDYKDTRHKSLAVADFSQAVFGDYYKRYYQTYQKMSEARKNATIRKIEKRVQKIRSQHETERIETTGYKDDMGDNVHDLIESHENA